MAAEFQASLKFRGVEGMTAALGERGEEASARFSPPPMVEREDYEVPLMPIAEPAPETRHAWSTCAREAFAYITDRFLASVTGKAIGERWTVEFHLGDQEPLLIHGEFVPSSEVV